MEADVHQAVVVQERQSQIHDQYADREQKMIARHRAFDAAFESKLQREIDELYIKFRKSLAFYTQKVASQAIRFRVEISEDEIAALFAPYELKDADAVEPPPPPPLPPQPRPRTIVSSRLFNPKFPLPDPPEKAGRVDE
jgi:hypothetical protein